MQRHAGPLHLSTDDIVSNVQVENVPQSNPKLPALIAIKSSGAIYSDRSFSAEQSIIIAGMLEKKIVCCQFIF